MQWVQDPSQSYADNLNNVGRAASRHFRNMKREYLKAEFEKFENKSKTKVLGTCIGASMNVRRITTLELL